MPVAVYCLVCDRLQVQSRTLTSLDVIGLTARVRSRVSPPFPLVCNDFRVFLLLTELERYLTPSVQIVQDSTAQVVHATGPQRISSPGTPDQLLPVAFQIHACRLPAEGLYWVECLNDGVVFVRQRLYAGG